jgi:hypothetical protein
MEALLADLTNLDKQNKSRGVLWSITGKTGDYTNDMLIVSVAYGLCRFLRPQYTRSVVHIWVAFESATLRNKQNTMLVFCEANSV